MEKIWVNDNQDGVELLAGSLDSERTVGIDKSWPARFLLRLMEVRPSHRFVNASAILDRLRMRKDADERELMREASRVNDLALARIVALLPKRYSEKRLAQCVPEIYDELGADGCAFEPIIAYGPNAAESHHAPDRRLLNDGDSVVIDIGCRKDSYCSDMTRTVFYQQAPDDARAVYAIVLEAQRRAIATVRPGVRFCDIDAAARDHIAAAGTVRSSPTARGTPSVSTCTSPATCRRPTPTRSSRGWSSPSSPASRCRAISASGSKIWYSSRRMAAKCSNRYDKALRIVS